MAFGGPPSRRDALYFLSPCGWDFFFFCQPPSPSGGTRSYGTRKVLGTRFKLLWMGMRWPGLGGTETKKKKEKERKERRTHQKWGVLRATKDKRRGTDGGFLVLGNGPRKSKPRKEKEKESKCRRRANKRREIVPPAITRRVVNLLKHKIPGRPRVRDVFIPPQDTVKKITNVAEETLLELDGDAGFPAAVPGDTVSLRQYSRQALPGNLVFSLT